MRSESAIWLPAGPQAVERSTVDAAHCIVDFNGELRSAAATSRGVELSYRSGSRAMARVETPPKSLEIDGAEAKLEMAGSVIVLPKGQHIVSVGW